MASVKIPEQKIILCGEYGVGKSSLFRRYATNTFVTATDRKSTLGLDHYEKVYRTGDREVKVSCMFIFTSLYIFYACVQQNPCRKCSHSYISL